MQCIHGDILDYRTKVTLEVEGQTFICRVGIVPRLDCAVLIGRDCPLLAQLLKTPRREPKAMTQQGGGSAITESRRGVSDPGGPLPVVRPTRGPT